MAVFDYKLELDGAIWAALEASDPFKATFNEGQRLKENVPDGTPKPGHNQWARVQRAPGLDYPNVSVRIIGNAAPIRAPGQALTPKTFAMNSVNYSAAVCDVGVPAMTVVRITVSHDKVLLPNFTGPTATVLQALAGKWPKLGLSWVTGFEVRSNRKIGRDGGKTKIRRTIDEIDVIVSMRQKLSVLTAT